jgi:pimeloyl-ACP methyl ester carboxylesterase
MDARRVVSCRHGLRVVNWRRTAQVGLGGAAVAAIGVGAVKLAGRQVRHRIDAELDDPLAPPADVEHRYLETADGGKLHLAVTGAGPPVVLLHGVTLQWWVWSAVIRGLRDHHRVVAWDMRGHGESEAGSEGVTLEACARDLELVLDSLDCDDAIVVGHSMGGMCLGRFAASHAPVLHQRVRGLVFLATSAAPVSISGLRGGLAALSGRMSTVSDSWFARDRATYRWRDTNLSALMVRSAFGTTATGRMIDDVRRMLESTPQSTVAEAGATIAAHNVRAELATIDVPSTILVGDRDLLTPVAHARVLHEVIAGSDLVVLHHIGHQVMQEDPQAVVSAVDRLSERGSP